MLWKENQLYPKDPWFAPLVFAMYKKLYSIRTALTRIQLKYEKHSWSPAEAILIQQNVPKYCMFLNYNFLPKKLADIFNMHQAKFANSSFHCPERLRAKKVVGRNLWVAFDKCCRRELRRISISSRLSCRHLTEQLLFWVLRCSSAYSSDLSLILQVFSSIEDIPKI